MNVSIQYHEKFIKRAEGDPKLRRDLASAYFRLGQLHFAEDHLDVARDDHGRALGLRKDLIREHPNDPALGLELAESLIALGRVNHNDRKMGEAEAFLRKAIEWLESL